MPRKPVIVELRHNKDLAAMAFAAVEGESVELDVSAAPRLEGVKYDVGFAPTSLPGRVARTQAESVYESSAFDLAPEPKASTYIVRAEVAESKLAALADSANVVGVFSDPTILPTAVCPGSPPVGTDADVERLLCTSAMRSVGMNGKGVMVAVVDTGVNMAYLNSKGKTPTFDAARSWVPRAGLTPGSLPVSHGTMVAFDVCIAAPACTLLDIALLKSNTTGPTPMSGLLSDAVRAYRHLVELMIAQRRPGEHRSLVVNNSWGMFHPSWDFPKGEPGNYSDNPNHPFNRIVGALESVGADILFAAGNCGADCADGRCQGVTDDAIYGANGHPAVLCVAGVDTTKTRAGYSTIGPGRLTRNKPDISGYTHFSGSGVYTADGGTSAATPVVAGVVAAVRTKRPFNAGNPSTRPAAIRTLLTSTAEDLGTSGYDFLHGYGVVNGCELRRRLGGVRPPIDICRRYPRLCRRILLCRRYPWLCRRPPFPFPIPPRPPFPPIPPIPPGPPGPGPLSAEADDDLDSGMAALGADLGVEGGESMAEVVAAAYAEGYDDGLQAGPAATGKAGGACGCGCGGQ